MASMHCPSCGSDYLRRSQRRNIRERLFSLTGFKPYVCEDCDHRFFARPGKRPAAPETQDGQNRRGGLRRLFVWGLLALGGVAIMGAWWMLPSQKDTPPKELAGSAKMPQAVPQATPTTLAFPVPAPGRPTLSTTTTTLMTTTTSATTLTSSTTIPLPLVTTTTRQKPGPSQPPPAEAEAKEKPGRPSARGPGPRIYSVQFGAFKGPLRAQALVRALARKGLSARVDKTSEKTKEVLYKVRVGHFQVRSQALAEQKRLKQATGMDCFVARVSRP